MVKGILKELNPPLVSRLANISGEKSPKGFSEISNIIKEKADFISPQEFQAKGTQASSIIKIFLCFFYFFLCFFSFFLRLLSPKA